MRCDFFKELSKPKCDVRCRLNCPQLGICRRLVSKLFHRCGPQQQSFCRRNCCVSVEQRVSCWKMSRENDDHAHREPKDFLSPKSHFPFHEQIRSHILRKIAVPVAKVLRALVIVFIWTCCNALLSQEIGWEERLRNDLFCVRWNVKS